MNGKGSKYRPTDLTKYNYNYDLIFRKKVKQESVSLKETKRHQTEDKLSVEFVIEHTPFKNDITAMQLSKMQNNDKILKDILNK